MLSDRKFLYNIINEFAEKAVNQSVLEEISEKIYGNKFAYIYEYRNGLQDVVLAIENLFDEEIENLSELKEINSVTEKVKLCIKKRIYGDGNRQKIYKELSKFYSKQENYRLYMKVKWNSADAIWRAVGDNSTDWNYYSKRTILYLIYAPTCNFYSKTDDPDFSKTSLLIDKFIARVQKFNKVKSKLSIKKIPFIRQFIK